MNKKRRDEFIKLLEFLEKKGHSESEAVQIAREYMGQKYDEVESPILDESVYSMSAEEYLMLDCRRL